jgi:hypothetical protein
LTNHRFLVALSLSIYAALFVIFAAAALFIGIEYTDTGFVIGLAHRISIGQQIYFDFDYVRPPITPLLWSLPLSFDIEAKEIFVRLLVLSQKCAVAILSYMTLRKCGVETMLSIWAGLITFAFLAHHIPMMPWHTTDGLFFAAIAITLYAYNSPITAIAFAFMAALTKQSFYPLPILLLAVSMLQFQNRRLAIALSFIFIIVTLLLNPYLAEFARIASETTSLRDLISAAIAPHIKLSKWSAFFLVCMLSALLVLKGRSIAYLLAIAIIFPLANMGWSVVRNVINAEKISFAGTAYGVTHIAMTFSLLHVLLFFKKEGFAAVKNKDFQVSIILLSAAWMSTISWGYANYLFAYGFLISANLILLKDKTFPANQFLFSLSYIALAAFLILRLVAPYRMDSPLMEGHKMIQSGHYKYVWASKVDFEKLSSIERISELEGCKDTYPSAPQSALIGGYAPFMRADWKMDVEFPSYKEAQSKLVSNGCKIFLEKDKRVVGWQGKFKSSAVNLESYKHCVVDFDNHFSLIDFSVCKPL